MIVDIKSTETVVGEFFFSNPFKSKFHKNK